MKVISGLALILLFPLSLVAQQSSHNGAAKYAPEDGQKLLIMGQDLGAVGGLDDYADGYVDHLLHVPAGVTTYTGFPSVSGLSEMANWGSGDVCAQAYVEDSTFDHSFIVIGLYLVDQLNSIVSGGSDDQLDQLGNWIKARQRPVFLRIGYEFDASWNHYDPSQYKEAWIYLVRYFDLLGIRNVSYVWQASGLNTSNIERWYPGDRYVNWMAFSNFTEPNAGANILASAELHNKPVMIAESAPRVDLKLGEGTAHWEKWYEPLFTKIYGNDRIKALAYINVNWDSQPMWQNAGFGDSRVQVNEVIKEKWQAEIRKTSWILASDSLFDLLNYNMWQDSLVGIKHSISEKDGGLMISHSGNSLIVWEQNHSLMDRISVWDISGRLLFLEKRKASQYELPQEKLGSGTILLRVEARDQVYRSKTLIH